MCAALNPLYKTELCISHQETKYCRYGPKCQFAHGVHELRPHPINGQYKSSVCRSYSETGTCRYGQHCRFLHVSASTRQERSNSLSATARINNTEIITASNYSLADSNEGDTYQLEEILASQVVFPTTRGSCCRLKVFVDLCNKCQC